MHTTILCAEFGMAEHVPFVVYNVSLFASKRIIKVLSEILFRRFSECFLLTLFVVPHE